mgnify:CR=1 FL=1
MNSGFKFILQFLGIGNRENFIRPFEGEGLLHRGNFKSKMQGFSLEYKIIDPFLIISLPYISISILSSINQLIRNLKSWRSTLILPLVFFTMHFAYGFGYLLGLFLFIFKLNDTEIKDSYFDKARFNNI